MTQSVELPFHRLDDFQVKLVYISSLLSRYYVCFCVDQGRLPGHKSPFDDAIQIGAIILLFLTS